MWRDSCVLHLIRVVQTMKRIVWLPVCWKAGTTGARRAIQRNELDPKAIPFPLAMTQRQCQSCSLLCRCVGIPEDGCVVKWPAMGKTVNSALTIVWQVFQMSQMLARRILAEPTQYALVRRKKQPLPNLRPPPPGI
jgi:hypothetical protein